MQPKTRGYGISDFLSWHQQGQLVLQPKFQRRDVWSQKAKAHLIDTILRGLPIPLIFIRQTIAPDIRRTVREVVDGQQRLNSIISFHRDGFPVLESQNPDFGGLTFSELPPEVQAAFLKYECPVILLEDVSDQDVLEIFARLNTYAQRLTPQELLNAAYFGQFKQTIYSLGYEHLEFWRQNQILTDREIVRMAEAELTSELVVTMLDGIQHRRGKMQAFYKKYDDVFEQKDKVVKEFRDIIDMIVKCLGDDLKGSLYSGRAVFHSLFCAFYHLKYGLPGTIDLPFGKSLKQPNTSDVTVLKDSLLTLQERYRLVPIPEDVAPFAQALQGGTADRDKRIARTKVIIEHAGRALRR